MRRPDHPLGFHWRPLNLDILDGFDLPPAKSADEEATRRAILTEAYLVARADPERLISYSRRKVFYEASRYRRTSYGYGNVVRTVDTFAAAGLIEHDRAPPGRLGYQSTFRAAPTLVSALSGVALPVVFDPPESVILRDRDGVPLDYKDTDRTRSIRRRLSEINEAVGHAQVRHPDLGVVSDGDPIRLGSAEPGPARRILHRVYTGDFNRHGRFYGPWWQNIPKSERAKLILNGEPVFEADYPRLHITLAYAEAGAALEGDPYDIPPWPMPLVKVAVNIVLNARDRTSALRALASHIGCQGAFGKASAVLRAVEQRHRPIAALFYSDAGMRLMNVDSSMAEGILMSLIQQGLVALPLHDSYLVEERKKGPLLEAMAGQLHRVLNQGATRCTDGEISPRVPHMDPPPSPAPGSPLAPVVVVVLPADLFGAPVVLAGDVFGWSGGFAPPSVRDAVRREVKRRGLTLDEAAARIEVSRPQLSNILLGRFGASSDTAERVRGFLLNDAVTVKSEGQQRCK